MRLKRENKKNSSQILVFLIVFLAVIVAMGVSFLYSGRSRSNIIGVQIDKTQAENAAHSGLEIGLRKLTEDNCSAWAGANLTIGGAEVNITVIETTQEYNVTSYAAKGRTHSTVSDIVAKPEIIGWVNAYGDADRNFFRSFQITDDGGYVIGGQAGIAGLGAADILLIKINSQNEVEWAKRYQGPASCDDVLNAVQQTEDGGYIFVGESRCGTDRRKGIVFKTNSQGDVSWAKELDTFAAAGNNHTRFSDIIQESDGYVLGGEAYLVSPDFSIILMKVDLSGNTIIVPLKYYDDSGRFYAFEEVSNGDYIFAGRKYNGVDYDALIMKTSNYSNVVDWAYRYGGSSTDNASRIVVLPASEGGGYIFEGWSASFGGITSSLVVSVGPLGGFAGARLYYGPSTSDYRLNAFKRTSDGGYIMSGFNWFYGGQENLVIKTDNDGNFGTSYPQTWAKRYQGPELSFLDLVEIEGAYVWTGYTDSFGNGLEDIVLIDTDKTSGNIECCDIDIDDSADAGFSSLSSPPLVYSGFNPIPTDLTDYNFVDFSYTVQDITNVIKLYSECP